MRMIKFALAWLAVCGLVLGCGGNGGTDCDKEAKIKAKGLDEGCEGRDDECWACDCYNQGKVVKVEAGTGGAVYSCIDPEEPEPCVDNPDTPDVNECKCEGKALTTAQNCLVDEEACLEMYIDMQNAACRNTLKS